MVDDEKITVVMCEPRKEAYTTQIGKSLSDLQKTVGGYIEVVYPSDDPIAVVCNEEGKINRMELNRALRDENGNVYDIVAGKMFICGLSEDDFASLSPEMAEKYLNQFKYPEQFFRFNGEIYAVPLKNETEHKTQKL